MHVADSIELETKQAAMGRLFRVGMKPAYHAIV